MQTLREQCLKLFFSNPVLNLLCQALTATNNGISFFDNAFNSCISAMNDNPNATTVEELEPALFSVVRNQL